MQETMVNNIIDYYRGSYPALWKRVFREMENEAGQCVWLLGPAAYVFFAGGAKWGMDIHFRMPWLNDALRMELAQDLRKLDFIILTHEHGDHLDYGLMELLRDAPVEWLIPEFFNRERLLATGIDKITWIQNGSTIKRKGLSISAFDSPHFQPDGKGVQETGYFVETGESKLLFPCDIRNYQGKIPDFGMVDYLFAHVWLGRSNAQNLPCEPFLSDFCDFMLSHRPQTILLTHLFDTSRPLTDMWTYAHAGLAANGITARSPETKIAVPRLGERRSLGKR